MEDENSDAYKEAEAQLEKDLKGIIEDDDNIEEIEMTECEFSPASDSRKRRQGLDFISPLQFHLCT